MLRPPATAIGSEPTPTDAQDHERNARLERQTLCLPDFDADTVIHAGNDRFCRITQQYFSAPESDAAERLVRLKTQLRAATTFDFWEVLLRALADITGAQSAFVTKRLLVDIGDDHAALPPLGQPGACFVAVAYYVKDDADNGAFHRDYKYAAQGTPCSHMVHDKVFVIPERMSEFIRENVIKRPYEDEAFIASPLFRGEKCFGHFGMIWSAQGVEKRTLGWGYIEMLMHALEDMVLQRALEVGIVPEEPTMTATTTVEVSKGPQPTWSSFLSHELRTPMQGCVGLLDLMHYSVMDAMEMPYDESAVRRIFEELKSSIERIQESSKRAVEAADNVVHAYDHNMQMPATPLSSADEEEAEAPAKTRSKRPNVVVEGLGIPMSPSKRRRIEPVDYHPGPPKRSVSNVAQGAVSDKSACALIPGLDSVVRKAGIGTVTAVGISAGIADAASLVSGGVIRSTRRHVVTLDLLRGVVHGSLCGYEPTSKVVTDSELGMEVVMETRGETGETGRLAVHLNMDAEVPRAIYTEEDHLVFALRKVIDNAVKFTKEGEIKILVSLARMTQLIEFRIIDTGSGMSETSKEHLFQPNFQEDSSTARVKDGLGLSLFNAKAHVRKDLGGDITLERSFSHGSPKGSEFLIRIPITNVDMPSSTLEIKAKRSRSLANSQPVSPVKDISCPSSDIKVPSPTTATPDVVVTPTTKRTQGYNRQLATEVPLNLMVAEDNKINRALLMTFLARLGYAADNISVAQDGVEAVAAYKASLEGPPERRINAVLMDLWMPNMDGYEATQRILDIARDANLALPAVMAVTADITRDSAERATAAGMLGFLSKPFKIVDIERLIERYFGAGV